jgi:hypothetical protein
MESIASITSDPTLKKNLLSTANSIAGAADQIKAIATDVHSITGDPDVQSNLKGAVGNLSAAIDRANILLGNFANDSGNGVQDRRGQPPSSQTGLRRLERPARVWRCFRPAFEKRGAKPGAGRRPIST